MALERDVLINNEIRGYHEISMVECVPNDHITITVESFVSKDDKDKLAERDDPSYAIDTNESYDYTSYDQYMPVDTYHELSCPDDGIIDISQIESSVWELPLFKEYIDATKVIDERDAIIAEMSSILTDTQLSKISNKIRLSSGQDTNTFLQNLKEGSMLSGKEASK